MTETQPPLLLHVCCGPCSTHVIEVLTRSHAVTLFFSNSNIWPEVEYRRRLADVRRVAGLMEVPLVEDAYDHDAWLACIEGFEQEPERGKRCEACFAFNLSRAGAYARDHGFIAFTTSLTVSPHKDSPTIFRLGEAAGDFLARDFKKQDGFKRSLELSRKFGLYRQDYCGCEFSRRND
jgi:predicted adenine nucleotide alpha hydrolase (AANH) superfamily ATPase